MKWRHGAPRSIEGWGLARHGENDQVVAVYLLVRRANKRSVDSAGMCFEANQVAWSPSESRNTRGESRQEWDVWPAKARTRGRGATREGHESRWDTTKLDGEATGLAETREEDAARAMDGISPS